jgi:hypothetical protein
MRKERKQLRTRNGIWVERGQWEPTYVLNQQQAQGIEYQHYMFDANGNLACAGVTRHDHMNQAQANQIFKVWLRWRLEYDNTFNKGRDYPAKHSAPYTCPVTMLVVAPIDQPFQQQSFRVGAQ